MAGFLKDKRQWFQYNWKALLAVIAIGLVPFLGFLTSPESLFASDQLASPSWEFFFKSLRHGLIPQWQPYILGGMPTFDAGFGDGGYPIFLLIGMLMPMKTFISWSFLVHVLIAGVGAYYLVNRLFRLDRLLSVALAAAYMLNTNYISHIHAGHTGKFYIMSWLPVALFLLLRSLRPGARWYHTLLFALTIALMMSPFHPQFLYYVLMGFFLVWAFQTFWLVKEKRYPQALASAVRFWAPILLGIGLVFFLLYPPLQWTKSYGIRGSAEKTTYEHATSWSMHPEETASLVVPEFTGLNQKYWGRNPFKLNSEYPGLSVLFLGILGLVLFRREKRGWFWLWGGIGLLAIVFGLGAHTPLFHLFYSWVPGIKNFRAPSMMLFWLATALLVMSGEALARLTGAQPAFAPDRRAAVSKRLAQIGFGCAAALLLMGLLPGAVFSVWDAVFGGEAVSNLANRPADQSAFAAGAIRAALLLAALVFAARKWLIDSVDSVRFGAALLCVTCLDLVWVDMNFIRTYDPGPSLASQPAVEYLKSDTSQFRVFGLPGTYERWTMQYHGIETTDGWTDNEYRLYRDYRGGDYIQNPNFMAGLKQNPDGSVSGSDFLDMLNVKYLAYRLQGEGGMRLAPNTSSLPRAWFVTAWDTLPDTLVLDRMKQPDFDPRKLAYLSGADRAPHTDPADPAVPPAAATTGADAQDTGAMAAAGASVPDSGTVGATAPEKPPAASIHLEHEDYNHSAWTVDAPKEGLLILSELWFPHWQVQVDGKPAPLLRADFAFRGIHLEPGTHRVTLTYASPWIRKGFIVSGLCVAVLAAVLAGLWMADRRKIGAA